MSTTWAPYFASADLSARLVAILGDVTPVTRSYGIFDDARTLATDSVRTGEHGRLALPSSVERHALYATMFPSRKSSVSPPQSPTIKTAPGRCSEGAAKATSALLLAFLGPIAPVRRTTSFF